VALLAGDVAGLLHLGLIGPLLAFGVAFVVPLGLARVSRLGMRLPAPLLLMAAGVLAVASFAPAPGLTAGVLATPWLLACLWMALAAVFWLWKGKSLYSSSLVPAASLAYLAVGSAWLVISRLGDRPLGFSGVIVELTAVHFHFAGFAAPLLALATGEALEARFSRLAVLARATGMGVAAAMPIVAAGFFAGQEVAAAGASLLATSLWLLAALMLPAAATLSGAQRTLLAIAATSVLGAMVLAVEYAAGPLIGLRVLSVDHMAQIHGMANAFGFSGCAMLAFSPLLHRRSRSIQ
jgi:hypothetical protein